MDLRKELSDESSFLLVRDKDSRKITMIYKWYSNKLYKGVLL